jgi:hypothetical protein
MAKCMQCGGMKLRKAQKGATMKTTVADKNAKTFIAGMPNSGPTGPNYQGINTMKNGGAKTSVPVQRSCPPGYVRKATGVGCVKMGKR